MHFLKFSGRKGYRDLGDRNGCNKQPKMQYMVIIDYLSTKQTGGLGTQDENGVCLPKSRNKEALPQLFAVEVIRNK